MSLHPLTQIIRQNLTKTSVPCDKVTTSPELCSTTGNRETLLSFETLSQDYTLMSLVRKVLQPSHLDVFMEVRGLTANI